MKRFVDFRKFSFVNSTTHLIIINEKNKLFIYADNIVLGATDDAVITWMKDAKNKKVLELIKKDTYPDLYEDKK